MKSKWITGLAAVALVTAMPAKAGHHDAAAWAVGGLVVGAVAGAAIASSYQAPATYAPAGAPPPTVVAAPGAGVGQSAPRVVVRSRPAVVYGPPVVVASAPVYGCAPVVVYRPQVMCRPPGVVHHPAPHYGPRLR